MIERQWAKRCEECAFDMSDGQECQRCGNRTWVMLVDQKVVACTHPTMVDGRCPGCEPWSTDTSTLTHDDIQRALNQAYRPPAPFVVHPDQYEDLRAWKEGASDS